tara:strand:- start:1903 stop:2100 length:198 start_codon:yes stop_codon:yes gene_type:complete
MAKKDPIDKLFDAFYDLVDTGLTNIKINKNGSKDIGNWTIQILDFRGKILAESKTPFRKHFEDTQ